MFSAIHKNRFLKNFYDLHLEFLKVLNHCKIIRLIYHN